MNHGWEKKRLGELGTIITGTTPKTSVESYYNSADIMFVKPGDIHDNRLNNLHRTETYISKQAYNEACRKLPKGSILVTCIGIIGKVAILDDYATCNQQINAIIPNNDMINRYLGYAILSIKDTLQSKKNGPIVPIINKTQFSTFKVPVPSIEVQQQIVSELDKINELIEVKRSQLADLDMLAQSLFYEMFGDPIENPKGWNLYNLGGCVEFKNGLNFTPSDNGNEIKCLGVGNFKSNRYISDESLPAINIVELVSKEYLLEDGDIVFVRSNGNKALIGRSILYTSKGADVTFSGFCIRCRYSKEKYNPLYMAYLLSSKTIRYYMTSQGKGCNISNINQKILSAMPFIVPPIELQNQFAAKIKMIEEQKEHIYSSVTDLLTLLASRMDYWFND